MFETTRRAGVCRFARSDSRWLATGWDGGYRTGDGAYNVSVPDGFDRTDLEAYSTRRLTEAGFERDGPVLLTGVDAADAVGARRGSVTVVATVGLSNPAALPIDGETAAGTEGSGDRGETNGAKQSDDDSPIGTVNLLVGTTRALDDGVIATLLASAVEAKAATLEATTGFTGTTSDAVVVGCAREGERAPFAGSGTELGNAVRVCVRDAICRGIERGDSVPDSVAAAEHGTVTRGRADPFRP